MIKIYLEGGLIFEFKGWHLPELEKPNWHYYRDDAGNLYHFRKDKMIAVVEKI